MSSLTQLGRYKIETHLGSGAFADVYKATDQTLKRTVALKILKPALVADAEAFGRFVQEAQVAANLFHPHIATVLDMGEAEGHYYLAMRFVDGLSLDKALAERGPLDWEQALEITGQIGAALDFAHKKGLVHRDIKPQNIILSEEEGAVLTDFGLVRAIASSRMTTTGSFLGTPHYMAPEIWEGNDATPAADQYALACILVEMLTNKVLFDGKTPPAVMTKHFKSLELPAAWPGNVPEEAAEALVRALSKAPEQRFSNNAEFLTALRQPTSNPKPKIVNPKSKIENPAGIEWVEIPAGDFLYGDKNEKHNLAKPFLIGKYPVTNAQYKRFLDANPNYPVPSDWDKNKRIYPAGKENHPVVNMTLQDVLVFCKSAKCRLPTELEWEKAARGVDGRFYPWGKDWANGKYCNSIEAKIRGTTPVDKYAEGVSPYGVWDLSGNVWEWTTTTYPQNGYILRGGSWSFTNGRIHASLRGRYVPAYSRGVIGFRVACSLDRD